MSMMGSVPCLRKPTEPFEPSGASARQAWEATPRGWTVPVPLEGWIFRLEPAPGGVRVIASAGGGREPVAWAVPRRAAGR